MSIVDPRGDRRETRERHPPMTSFEITRMRAQEQDAAVVTLARAFHDDPMFNFLVPNALAQARATLTFMASRVADAAPFEEIWVARRAAKFVGVAAWLPPAAYPRSARREIVNLVRDLPSVPRLGRRTPAGLRIEAALAHAHRQLTEPHWYLSLLGSDPAFQGRGVGTALLAPVIDRGDADGVPAYLETQKADNVPWYQRIGFQVVDRLEPRGCPPMWTMRREPGAPGGRRRAETAGADSAAAPRIGGVE
jgi:GNAT superfamily N-acetyltransferase